MDRTEFCQACRDWYPHRLGACPECGTLSGRTIEFIAETADPEIEPAAEPRNRKEGRAQAARRRRLKR